MIQVTQPWIDGLRLTALTRAYPAGMPKRSLCVVTDHSTQEFVTAVAQLDA